MFYVKKHSANGESILAVCDKEVLGKTFKQDDLMVSASKAFYEGSLASEKEVVKLMKDAGNINLLGEKTVSLAIQHDIVDEQNTLNIAGTSHALVVRI